MYLHSSNLLLTKPFKWWDQHVVSILDLRVEEEKKKSKTRQQLSFMSHQEKYTKEQQLL